MQAESNLTFGRAIASARKTRGLSQKQLASRVLKEEGGSPISQPYLNDIENDRRKPTSDHLIRQIATALEVEEDLMFFLAGKIPDDLRDKSNDPDKIVKGFSELRSILSR